MKLNDDTRTRLLVDVVLDVDPAGATLELKIDDTWYPCDWQGAATESGGKWSRAGRTSGYFAGPTVPPDGAVVLDGPRHLTETRVAWVGGDTIVERSTPIDVD